MWTTQVRSLLGERPVESRLLKGGRNCIGLSCQAAAARAHKDRKQRTMGRITAILDQDGGYLTSVQLAVKLGVVRDYVTRTCKQMARDGLLRARQDKLDSRHTWSWATK